MELEEAKSQLFHLIDGIQDPLKKEEFLSFIRASFGVPSAPQPVCTAHMMHFAELKLRKIVAELRSLVPIEAVDKWEPTSSTQDKHVEFYPKNTVHIDAFLYTDHEVDDLCDDGILQRNYCTKCGSRDVKPLDFISHSMSKERARFFFLTLLPNLVGKRVLDIGSGIGAVLFGAYVYTKATEIVGVEMNPTLCDIQRQVVEKLANDGRITIVCDDIRNRKDLLSNVDVVIMHNVFEFFLSLKDQIEVWKFIAENLRRPGVLLATVPSLETSFSSFEVPPVQIDGWLKKVPLSRDAEFQVLHHPELAEVQLYEVL